MRPLLAVLLLLAIAAPAALAEEAPTRPSAAKPTRKAIRAGERIAAQMWPDSPCRGRITPLISSKGLTGDTVGFAWMGVDDYRECVISIHPHTSPFAKCAIYVHEAGHWAGHVGDLPETLPDGQVVHWHDADPESIMAVSPPQRWGPCVRAMTTRHANRHRRLPNVAGCMSDCGLRIGEMLALERGDIDADWLLIRRTAYNGRVEPGTKTTRGAGETGSRAPLPPELRDMLTALPPRIDTRRLFPPTRGAAWQARRFYDDVWQPAREATGMLDARAHEFRHSFVSLMRAAGVDPAHLAEWTGHTVLTATTAYTHAVGDVSEQARALVPSRSQAV